MSPPWPAVVVAQIVASRSRKSNVNATRNGSAAAIATPAYVLDRQWNAPTLRTQVVDWETRADGRQ
ncbi:hypothetical protein BDSB_05130 [Burkholderia dolosa PC543]|nr:hypothetical protein BDSB_05130 [Burkholderia dolosa PC543]